METFNAKHYYDLTASAAIDNADRKKKVRNRSNARKQQASGKEFEKQLERIHKWYASKNIAMISKVPTATRPIPSGKGVKWIPAEKTGCDYLGVYRGKAVALEAKQSSTTTRWDLFSRGEKNVDKKTVAEHQQRYLLQHKACGGLAYVLIKIRPTQALYKVDIEDYVQMEKEAIEMGKKSFPIGQLEPYKVVTKDRIPDYLRE